MRAQSGTEDLVPFLYREVLAVNGSWLRGLTSCSVDNHIGTSVVLVTSNVPGSLVTPTECPDRGVAALRDQSRKPPKEFPMYMLLIDGQIKTGKKNEFVNAWQSQILPCEEAERIRG